MFWIIRRLWLIDNVPKQNYTRTVYELNLYDINTFYEKLKKIMLVKKL